jgi:hypothetical protein
VEAGTIDTLATARSGSVDTVGVSSHAASAIEAPSATSRMSAGIGDRLFERADMILIR